MLLSMHACSMQVQHKAKQGKGSKCEALYLSYIGARGVIIRGIILWRCEMQDEQKVTEWSNRMESEVMEQKSNGSPARASLGLTAWFMNITKVRIKSSIWDLKLKSFCLDVDSEAISFLTSKLVTTFLESFLLFCIILISSWCMSNTWIMWHTVITIGASSHQHIKTELQADCTFVTQHPKVLWHATIL